jgi:hypothetical protein
MRVVGETSWNARARSGVGGVISGMQLFGMRRRCLEVDRLAVGCLVRSRNVRLRRWCGYGGRLGRG